MKTIGHRFIAAIFFGALVFGLLSLYLLLRRGYYDLYIINKAAANTGIFLLGFALLLGPLSRLYNRFDHALIYRKEVGMASFIFILGHAAISLFFLPAKFNIAYYQNHLSTLVAGLLSTVILLILFVESYKFFSKRLNPKLWWSLQNWGVRIAGLLAYFHVVAMKQPGWLVWFREGGSKELARPYLPPGSLLGGIFFTFLIVIRLEEFLLGMRAKKVVVVTSVVFLSVYVLIFAWGIIS